MDQVPPEVVAPPAGVVVRVKAPPANKLSATWADRRTEIGRQMIVATSTTGRNGAEIVVPYAGGPLPPEALNPPPDTVVLLEHVPGLSDKAAHVAASSARSAPASVPDIVLEYLGGPLPEEAVSPSPGMVVGLLASSLPADDEARESVAEVFGEVDAAFVIDIPYIGAGLPDEALEPPLDTVIRLRGAAGRGGGRRGRGLRSAGPGASRVADRRRAIPRRYAAEGCARPAARHGGQAARTLTRRRRGAAGAGTNSSRTRGERSVPCLRARVPGVIARKHTQARH